MESEEGDARSVISGSLKESVELLPDQLEEPSADAMNGELYDEPDQNQVMSAQSTQNHAYFQDGGNETDQGLSSAQPAQSSNDFSTPLPVREGIPIDKSDVEQDHVKRDLKFGEHEEDASKKNERVQDEVPVPKANSCPVPQVGNTWTCSCGTVSRAHAKFCEECGRTKPRIDECTKCGAAVTAKFCAQCGEPKNVGTSPQPEVMSFTSSMAASTTPVVTQLGSQEMPQQMLSPTPPTTAIPRSPSGKGFNRSAQSFVQLPSGIPPIPELSGLQGFLQGSVDVQKELVRQLARDSSARDSK